MGKNIKAIQQKYKTLNKLVNGTQTSSRENEFRKFLKEETGKHLLQPKNPEDSEESSDSSDSDSSKDKTIDQSMSEFSPFKIAESAESSDGE